MRPGSSVRTRIQRYDGGAWSVRPDTLATEEPLEIRLAAGDQHRTLSITMRTPGNDFELAAGFLFGEGVLQSRDELVGIRYCVDAGDGQQYNVVSVDMRNLTALDRAPAERRFYSSSACGICGSAGIESLEQRSAPLSNGPIIDPRLITRLPAQLNDSQRLFASTGGLHGAALFTVQGTLLALREDVGRHNAVDKLIGWALMNNRLPLHNTIMLVSGRVGYEIAQKCIVAGIPILCAISAPSSLAVATARAFDMTLVGFLRGERFNVYTGSQRLATAEL